MVSKIKPLKNRNGCIRCKQRRVKCDEQRPQCGHCTRLGFTGKCHFDANFVAPKGRKVSHGVSKLNGRTHLEVKETETFELLDLELVHHFSTQTYRTMAAAEISAYTWQVDVPILAYTHSFVMHGMIASAALHRAALDRENVPKYCTKATEAINKLLPYLQSHVSGPNQDSIHALAAGTIFVHAYAFALPAVRDWRSGPQSPLDELYSTMTLIRGSVAVMWNNQEHLRNGPLQNIWDRCVYQRLNHVKTDEILQMPATTTDNIDQPSGLTQDKVLKQLSNLYSQIETSPDASDTTLDAIIKLRYMFQQFELEPLLDGRDPDYYYPAGPIFGWSGLLKPEFMAALRARDHAALVVLCYFVLLLREHCWFTTGWRDWILDAVSKENLAEPWEAHVSWILFQLNSMKVQ